MCGATLPETANPQHEKGIDGPIRQPAWQAMTCRWQGRFICSDHPQWMPEYPPYRYAFHGPSAMRAWDAYRHRTGMRRPGKQWGSAPRKPARQGVCHASGGRGRTCGVPPSIRWTGKSGQGRAERMGEGGRKADCPQRERRQSGGPRPWLQARRTERDKSFRGDGGAGGRETLFQKGPLPPVERTKSPSAVPADA